MVRFKSSLGVRLVMVILLNDSSIKEEKQKCMQFKFAKHKIKEEKLTILTRKASVFDVHNDE